MTGSIAGGDRVSAWADSASMLGEPAAAYPPDIVQPRHGPQWLHSAESGDGWSTASFASSAPSLQRSAGLKGGLEIQGDATGKNAAWSALEDQWDDRAVSPEDRTRLRGMLQSMPSDMSFESIESLADHLILRLNRECGVHYRLSDEVEPEVTRSHRTWASCVVQLLAGYAAWGALSDVCAPRGPEWSFRDSKGDIACGDKDAGQPTCWEVEDRRLALAYVPPGVGGVIKLEKGMPLEDGRYIYLQDPDGDILVRRYDRWNTQACESPHVHRYALNHRQPGNDSQACDPWSQVCNYLHFRHSQFIHPKFGNEQLCAGEMRVRNGQVEVVDVDSGHFKDPVERIAACLLPAFRSLGIPVSRNLRTGGPGTTAASPC